MSQGLQAYISTDMSLDGLANIPGFENFPLQPAPPGVTPNFINPVSNAYQVDIVSTVCLVLIFVFAGIRFYVKAVFLKTRTRDDCESLMFTSVSVLTILRAISFRSRKIF